MLFHSLEFLLLFLPVTLLVFLFIRQISSLGSLLWLSIASLFFYGYWNYRFIPLITGSIIINFCVGRAIILCHYYMPRKIILLTGIGLDLALLSYYKYSNFFITIINDVTQKNITLLDLVLPLGISFFTFTQIAYLVDCYHDKVKDPNFIKYFLFVVYFPHLIAGPILHHKEMIRQFNNLNNDTIVSSNVISNFICGITMFTIGLFKKIIFADGIAKVADIVFNAAQNGFISFTDAWLGTLAYTLQIYFDFSGYSDMAIGISMLFGIKLPINFNSPYKATSIIEFWRRWHVTLSIFLRDYIYIPLGGNQKGATRRYVNLLLTMLIGGIWHGAGWTFLIWGTLHGLFLTLNHFWRFICRRFSFTSNKIIILIYACISILSVMIAWVFFRANNAQTALTILKCLFISHDIPSSPYILFFDKIYLAFLSLIVLVMPNSLQIMGNFDIALNTPVEHGHKWYRWRISPIFTSLSGFLTAIAILSALAIGDGAQFLYFEF